MRDLIGQSSLLWALAAAALLASCSALVDPPRLTRCAAGQAPRCEGGTLVECAQGYERRLPCGSGGCAAGRCASTPDAGADLGADADAAAPEDGGTKRCTPWTGAWTFSAPKLVSELSSSSSDTEIHVMGDGLTIYFSSNRAGGVGGRDIYVATRKSRAEPFGQPVNMTGVNSSASDLKLVVAEDDLTAVLNTTRPGGAGAADLWLAVRASPTQPLLAAMFSPITQVNTAESEFDPFLTPDLKTLYFSAGPSGKLDLMVATRASAGGSFGAPTPLSGINAAESDDSPSLTADGRVLIFGSSRPGLGGRDIWYATRPDAAAAFSTPKPLPGVNTAYTESEAIITPDGCELYFASDRPGGPGGMDIYHSVLQ